MFLAQIEVRRPFMITWRGIQAQRASFTMMDTINYCSLLEKMMKWNGFWCTQAAPVNHWRLTVSLKSKRTESNKSGCWHNGALWAHRTFTAQRRVKYVSEDAYPVARAGLPRNYWVIPTGFHASAVLLSPVSAPELSKPDFVCSYWAKILSCSEQFCCTAIAACCFPIC